MALLMYFDAIASSGSVSKAAQQMRVTQPAMSNALAALRVMFSDPLFVKSRGGVAPTPKALELVPAVRRALETMEDVLSKTGRFDPQTSRVRLTLTATDYVNLVLMPRLLPYLERHAPQIELDVRTPNRELADEWLKQGEIDYRIGWVSRPPSELHYKTLYEDEFVCLVRRGHPVVKGKLSTEQYCGLTHLRTQAHRFTELTESAPVIDQAVAALGHRLNIAIRSPDYLSVPFIIARSNLIATVPRRLAMPFLRILPIRIMPAPIELPAMRVSVFWHERTQHNALHRWFRSALGMLAKDIQ